MSIRARMTPLIERLLSEGPANPTLRDYLTLLSSKLTQYDVATGKRESKRGSPNIYRLGHLLKASQQVQDRVKTMLDDTSPEARAAFEKALAAEFVFERGEFALAPVRNVVKQLRAGTCKLTR
jgi:hypothetical protein